MPLLFGLIEAAPRATWRRGGANSSRSRQRHLKITARARILFHSRGQQTSEAPDLSEEILAYLPTRPLACLIMIDRSFLSRSRVARSGCCSPREFTSHNTPSSFTCCRAETPPAASICCGCCRVQRQLNYTALIMGSLLSRRVVSSHLVDSYTRLSRGDEEEEEALACGLVFFRQIGGSSSSFSDQKRAEQIRERNSSEQMQRAT